jgi:hypothetical protein
LIKLKNTMITIEKQNELHDKILKGLEISYERLIAYKKYKNSVLVVMRDNKIVKIKPEDL